MAEKKRKSMKREIEGELIFKEVTPSQVKFDFDRNPKIRSNRNFDVIRELLPTEFDHQHHEVKATYQITIETVEK